MQSHLRFISATFDQVAQMSQLQSYEQRLRAFDTDLYVFKLSKDNKCTSMFLFYLVSQNTVIVLCMLSLCCACGFFYVSWFKQYFIFNFQTWENPTYKGIMM